MNTPKLIRRKRKRRKKEGKKEREMRNTYDKGLNITVSSRSQNLKE